MAERNYLVPRADEGERYLEALRRIIDREQIDVLIPNNDLEVPVIADARETLNARTLLPSSATIRRCQDKFALHQFLAGNGLSTSETHPIRELGEVDAAIGRFPPGATLWCRMRRGNGSKGALPVKTAEQAIAWIKYWNEMRGVPIDSFTLGEYLPGRDFAFQSLWHHGKLVIAKTCERLEYLYAGFMPSGTSSTPRVGRLTANEEVNDACVRAISALDPDASGMFCVDLKENEQGVPIITEINVGRFFQISEAFNTVGEYNMAELFVRLSLRRIGGAARSSAIFGYRREADLPAAGHGSLSDCYRGRRNGQALPAPLTSLRCFALPDRHPEAGLSKSSDQLRITT
ncbi:MAG: hypothetical protein R3F11_13595 [Verrucomicrobiales bacterium]